MSKTGKTASLPGTATAKNQTIPEQLKQVSGNTWEKYPFIIVKRAEKDHVIVFGKHMIIPDSFETIEEARQWIDQIPWIAILNVLGIYIDHRLAEEQQEYLNNINPNKQ